jgi:hypothetical protein
MKNIVQLVILLMCSCLASHAKQLDLLYLPLHDNDGSTWTFSSSAERLRETPVVQNQKQSIDAPLTQEAAVAIGSWHFTQNGPFRKFKIAYVRQEYVNLSGNSFKGGRNGEYRDFYVMTAIPLNAGCSYRPNHSKQTIVVLMDGTVLTPRKIGNAT